MPSAEEESLYLGLDLSTQQLKAVVVSPSSLVVIAEAKVDFDADFGAAYPIAKGVVAPPGTHEVYAPVAMWLEALDLVLDRLRARGGADMMGRIRGVAGSCQQHGSVYWGPRAGSLLAGLGGRAAEVEGGAGLATRLAGALAHPWAPNWQDSSTQEECDAFEAAVGGPRRLAEITGSSAHHRFTGPQILRLRKHRPDVYAATSRISLLSSFLASVLLGAFAPLDIADVCGMNLWDMRAQEWSEPLLALTAGSGGQAAVADLRTKLGEVRRDGGGSLGPIAAYFTVRHGLGRVQCLVAPFTGDNPATVLALPLRPGDAIVSLGTSTTFLTVTPHYRPDPAYHFFHHPAIPGQFMFMLCYKNGGLARETVRDALGRAGVGGDGDPWETFNRAVLETAPLGLCSKDPAATKEGGGGDEADRAKLGLYFDLPEIVPRVPAGTWRFTCAPDGTDLRPAEVAWPARSDARAIVESQCLSMRLRSRALVDVPPPPSPRPISESESESGITTAALPPQPRRIYLAGGGSVNPAVAQVVADVLGGTDGVYKLEAGGGACALGGAYKAAWALERRGPGELFDAFVGARWAEEDAARRVEGVSGYRRGVWEGYGAVLAAFEEMEWRVSEGAGDARG